MRILIAEDDPIALEIAIAAVSKWGHEPVACEDGEAAWQTMQAEDAPNLLLLDWFMPGLDGLEVTRRVRQQPHTRLSYIILVTTRGRRQDIVAGLESGADDYVVKPFDEEELGFMRRELKAVYDRFLDRVAEGRGLDRDDVEAVAQGRVWTGRQALEHGLVDRLGTWTDALRLVREKAGIPHGRFRVVRPRTRRAARWPWPPMPTPPGQALPTVLAGLPADVVEDLLWLAGPDAPRVVTWAPVWWE